MNIPKHEQIIGVLRDGRVPWFSKWLKGVDLDKKPSSYIDVTVDEVFEFVKKNGFDESLVAYRPLEARYLIERDHDMWCASFHERGMRQGPNWFITKEEAERYIVGRLIEGAKMLLDGQF